MNNSNTNILGLLLKGPDLDLQRLAVDAFRRLVDRFDVQSVSNTLDIKQLMSEACRNNHPEVVRLSIGLGINPNVPLTDDDMDDGEAADESQLPIIIAFEAKSTDVFHLLLSLTSREDRIRILNKCNAHVTVFDDMRSDLIAMDAPNLKRPRFSLD